MYLGAAPGVGKTYAMLGEGRRRLERGTDVVVGLVETHGRQHTAEMLTGLEVVPRRTIDHRGVRFEEMDVDAVLRRAPRVALVDELAHTNVPGSRHVKRWQDVDELLAAGIDVITTVNIQHLESVNDVVEKITGVPQRETVPDAVVRAAGQVELCDMSGEALRRRLAHGNVYAPEKIDAALGNYFRLGNLNALREIALLWTADRVDDALDSYRDQHEITGTWETRERVVVALTGGPEGEALVRRAHRITARAGGELLAVHVAQSDGLAGVSNEALAEQRRLVESLGGSYHQVLGDDVAESLLSFARAENATQLVLGVSRRSRLTALLTGPGIGASTIRASGDIDVHIVTHEHAGTGRLPRRGGALSRRRRVNGFVLAVLLPVLGTLLLVPLDRDLNLVSDMLLFLLITVVVAIVGGLLPALVAAVLGSMLLNYFFTPPLHTLSIRDANNALALFVFIAVGMLVSSVVDAAARRTREAARSAAEARTLADLATSVFAEGDALGQMLERLREAFALESVTLLEKAGDGWRVLAATGVPCGDPDRAESSVPAGEGRVLAMRGRLLEAEDRRVVGAFGAQVAVLLDRIRLRETAAAAGELEAANRMRTALLAAVGHDLRTPLAAAKASVSSLLSSDVHLDRQDRHDLLAAADESLDRLAGLVDNLLDMSRLQAGALSMSVQPTAVDEVVARALDDLGPSSGRVQVDVPAVLPAVSADPGLLERVVANLLANALRYSPADHRPLVTASRLAGVVEVRVVDRGPGIPEAQRDEVFVPFQRLGDTDNTTGIGLGLALSRGLTEAMGGSLDAEETPGGGLTMVVRLRVAADDEVPEPGLREREASNEPQGTAP
ncbi:MAG: sensor histidine kinase KdpD [Marmoricola sp.]|nr:sensor histidine kinase KdpD [Marmoricola sp.]